MNNQSSSRPPNDRTEHRQSLLIRPRESFAVELKSWFDPREPHGIAKLIKATFALRNQNGGFLVVGVDDRTLKPVTPPIDFPPVRECFHPDLIQQTLSKYASQSFEATVDFETIADCEYPIVSVQGGVVVPVACRADLRSKEGQFLLRENDIYVRTLESNGSISSARISWRDLPDALDRCFDNREANHARFFNKILPGLAPQFAALAQASGSKPATEIDFNQKKILERGVARFVDIAKERNVDVQGFGYWDVALEIIPAPNDYAPNRRFLETLRNANPDLTGWPVWLDSSAFHDTTNHPYVYEDAWEAFIYAPRKEGSFSRSGHFDFWILDPHGRFFLRRVLQDDLGASSDATRGKTVDPVLAVLRAGEAIAVGQHFARAMECPDETELRFMMQWSGLKGRQLEAWSSPMRWFNAGGPAKQDTALSSATLEVGATREVIIARTWEATLPLTRVFDGYELKEPIVRELVEKLLDRRL
jgi:hypothetical protein